MPGYSVVLIAVGSLACFGALGWFAESAADNSEINEDAVPEETMQKRSHIYMAAVVVAMCSFIA
jgi:Flp pilus assembly protein CpaB